MSYYDVRTVKYIMYLNQCVCAITLGTITMPDLAEGTPKIETNDQTMDQFLGKDYLMVSQEGFEQYLEFLGLNYFKRKIAANVRPTQTLSRNEDGSYTFNVRAAIFNWDIVFTPGVEFDGKKPDGNKVKGLITFEGNVMTHIQTDDEGRISTHVLVFTPEETVVTTTVEGSDLVAKRVYKIVEE